MQPTHARARRRQGPIGLLLILAIWGGSATAQTLVDATGARFSAARPAQRVISLAPSLTEEIFALGADGGLVGDTIFCRYPAGALTKTKIGSTLSPNLELMVALRPDLVVATVNGNRMATVQQLRRLGLRVFVLGEASSFADIAAQFRVLAQLVGHAQTAATVLREATVQVDAVRARMAGQPGVRTFFEIEGPSLVTTNDSTFLGEILRDAGAINVVGNNPSAYPHLSREAVLRANPDVVLIANEQADPSGEVRSWMRFPDLAAVRCHRIYLVPSDVFDQPTPTRFAAAVRIAAQLLHPEAK